MQRLRIGDIIVGQELPTLSRQPTRVTLFLFGVAYWTAHRIHWDKDWAQSEGYPDVLVPAPLATSYLTQMLVTWTSDPGCIKKLSTTFRALMHPTDTLTAGGIVRNIDQASSGALVECDIYLENQEGVKPIVGNAIIRIPS